MQTEHHSEKDTIGTKWKQQSEKRNMALEKDLQWSRGLEYHKSDRDDSNIPDNLKDQRAKDNQFSSLSAPCSHGPHSRNTINKCSWHTHIFRKKQEEKAASAFL